ncbi:MAG: D-alanyl-D-alanine carboxypeptidase [Rickettsiaceae bacterium]|nr:MAG: D-alanyl-D-alanine carboxypeptidase [Rickettsiaceae bacterium]
MKNNIIGQLLLFVIGFAALTQNTQAAKIKRKPSSCTPASAQTSLVMDSKTGEILHAQNERLKVFPASLAKLMTLKLTFEALETGKLTLRRQLYVSQNAEKMPPSKLGLKKGSSISVADAINALIVKSANDGAVVLAEGIGGSEANFAKLMNNKAKQLGMHDTNFENASGLHHPIQKTTAIDLAKLSLSLKRDHPRFYPLFSQTSFDFKGVTINGHNRVMANYIGAEGLKTGFTCPAGFNLITSASRGNKALIAVVTGSNNRGHRDQKMVALLDKHFDVYKPTKLKTIATLSKNNVAKLQAVKVKKPIQKVKQGPVIVAKLIKVKNIPKKRISNIALLKLKRKTTAARNIAT